MPLYFKCSLSSSSFLDRKFILELKFLVKLARVPKLELNIKELNIH